MSHIYHNTLKYDDVSVLLLSIKEVFSGYRVLNAENIHKNDIYSCLYVGFGILYK